jgi:hypothetical protein
MAPLFVLAISLNLIFFVEEKSISAGMRSKYWLLATIEKTDSKIHMIPVMRMPANLDEISWPVKDNASLSCLVIQLDQMDKQPGN